MANKKTKTKKPLIGKKRQDVFFLVSGLLLIGFLIFGLYQRTFFRSQAKSFFRPTILDHTQGCNAEDKPKDGCGLGGCPACHMTKYKCIKNVCGTYSWSGQCIPDDRCKKIAENQEETNQNEEVGLIQKLRNCAFENCSTPCQPTKNKETIKLSQQCTDCVKTCMEQ